MSARDRRSATATPGVANYLASGPYSDPDATTERLGVPRPANYVWARTAEPRLSAGAAVGIVLAVTGLCASATGVLAPEGFAIGFLGLAFCLVGLSAGRADGVTGRGLASFGMICALGAIVLAVLAVTHALVWPDSRVDEVARAHAWVVARLPWLDL